MTARRTLEALPVQPILVDAGGTHWATVQAAAAAAAQASAHGPTSAADPLPQISVRAVERPALDRLGPQNPASAAVTVRGSRALALAPTSADRAIAQLSRGPRGGVDLPHEAFGPRATCRTGPASWSSSTGPAR